MSKTTKKSGWVLPILTAIIFFLFGSIIMFLTGPKVPKNVYIDQKMQECAAAGGSFGSSYQTLGSGDTIYGARCRIPDKDLFNIRQRNGVTLDPSKDWGEYNDS